MRLNYQGFQQVCVWIPLDFVADWIDVRGWMTYSWLIDRYRAKWYVFWPHCWTYKYLTNLSKISHRGCSTHHAANFSTPRGWIFPFLVKKDKKRTTMVKTPSVWARTCLIAISTRIPAQHGWDAPLTTCLRTNLPIFGLQIWGMARHHWGAMGQWPKVLEKEGH